MRGYRSGIVAAVMAACACCTSAIGGEGVNCSFRNDPDLFLSAQSRARLGVFERAGKFQRDVHRMSTEPLTIAPSAIPKQNFIDDAIFGKLTQKGVDSARLTADEEFLRRVTLDLTGR